MPSPSYRSSYEEQQLYDHFIDCRRLESPEDLIERFRCLLIDGIEYPNSPVLTALYRLVTSGAAEQEFKYVLNRCCRILVNFWWFQPSQRWAIAQLIDVFEAMPRGAATHLGTQRLRKLVRQFLKTEEYRALQRLVQVIEQEQDAVNSARAEQTAGQHKNQGRSLRHQIHRYPYLYLHCLGGTSSEQEYAAVQNLQTERQHKYECELSRYVTYLVQQSSGSGRSPMPVKNPTLLSDTQLKTAINQFTGQVEGTHTYRDLARHFTLRSSQAPSYRAFKEGLYQYLITSIDAKYGNYHFNHWLQTQLKNTLPQSDTQRLNSFLVNRTYQQLLDSLVASPQNAGSHVIFVDLVTNVGATSTVGLLLKLLLLYGNLKSALEKRFASLYRHYEPVSDGVEWLIESLENLQIAFSIHFGSARFPCLSQGLK
jgi:hypothetical protein